jgi:hypothetical protein
MCEAFLRALCWGISSEAIQQGERTSCVQVLYTFKSQPCICASDYDSFPSQIHVGYMCFAKSLAAQHFGDFDKGCHDEQQLLCEKDERS